ncbi:MAG: PA14 domain-containing protein [Armatimonadota bacterium]
MRPVYLFALAAIVLSGCGGGGGGQSVAPLPINQSPSVSLVTPASNPITVDLSVSRTVDLSFKADDPDDTDLQYVATCDAGNIDPADGSLTAGAEKILTYTAPESNGTYYITLSVNDGEETVEKKVEVHVVGAHQPGLQLVIRDVAVDPSPVRPGEFASLSADVSNPQGGELTYTWRIKGNKVIGSSPVVQWTAPEIAGVYGIYLTVTNGTETAQYGVPVTVSQPEGGLLGQYFKTYRDRNWVKFGDELLSRADPNVNFNWWELSPQPGTIPSDGFGARWTGFIRCEQSGTYTFRVFSDDGARMRIMNDAGEWVAVIPNVSANWQDQVEGAWLPEEPIALQLNGGKWYPIELDYFEGGGDARITLYWSVNGAPEVVVPQSVLKLPG